ncbi:MAG TPA: hypothetical protein VF406_15775 [Thermodesulfobacteriota bacterium]
MRPPRAPLLTALLLLLALGSGCGASGADSPPVGGSPGGGGGGGTPGGGGPGAGVEWQDPERIEFRSETASEARVAVDPTSGDAVAVWLQSDGSRVALWASRLDRSTGEWSTPEAIDTEGIGNSRSPQLAADGDGNVFAVWVRNSNAIPSEPTVWVARHTAAGVWEEPEPLDAGAGPGQSPQVAANDSGVAVVAWIQGDGTDDSVWVSRFDPFDETWRGPDHAAAGSPAEDASSPSIDISDTGDVFVAWVQRASAVAQPGIWVNRFDVDLSAWNGPDEIDGQPISASSPQVGADADGNAVVLWEQAGSIHARRFVKGTPSTPSEWGTPQELDTSGQTADHAALAVAPTGHAVAIWRRDGGGGRIHASRLDPSSGDWSAAARVQTSTTAPSDAPHVALDPSGNAIAVWQQDPGDGKLRIRSSRLAASASAWSTDELVKENNAPGDVATAPRVAVDADGNAVAVWLEDADGVKSVWGNVRE